MRVHVSDLDHIELSNEQITALLFSADDLRPVDYALVMGGYQHARADRAAEMYWRGLTRRIIVTGGVTRDAPNPVSQAEFLKAYLLRQGIKEDDLLTEDQSQNTVENLQRSTRLIDRRSATLGLITIPYHALRVRLTAAAAFPEHSALVFPDTRLYIRDVWPSAEPWRERVLSEVVKLAEYARRGDILNALLDLP